MHVRALLTEERAVSPVIGVILMVAITVILAAVIGTFVLGLAPGPDETTPTASIGFDFDRSTTNVTVAHEGGDTLSDDNSNAVEVVDDESGTTTNWLASESDGIAAGDSVEHDYGTDGATVRVVWTGPNNESSAVLGRQQAPQ